jgi:hypothetical protein
MTWRGDGDRLVVWLLLAGVVVTAAAQILWWLRPLGAPIFQPPGVESAAPRATTSPETPYAAAGPANAPIAAAAISPHGTLVAILDDSGEVTVWDVQLATLISRFASGLQPSRRRSPSPIPIAIRQPMGEGLPPAVVAIGGDDGILRAWNAENGTRILTGAHSARDAASPELRRAPIVDVEISPKGRPVSVSSNGSLAFWAERQLGGDSSLLGITRGPGGKVRDVAIQSNLRWMAAVSDDAVYLSAVRNGLQTWTAVDTSTGGSPQSVYFSRHGWIVATVWSDGEIRLSRGRGVFSTLPPLGQNPARRLVAFANDWDVNVMFRDDGVIAATDGDRVIKIKWLKRAPNPGVTLTAPRGPIQSLWFTADNRNVVFSARGDRYLRTLRVPDGPAP